MATAVATPDLRPALSPAQELRARLLPYALIGPSIAAIAGILGFPLAMLVYLSLQRYGLKELIAHQGVWIGLDNFRSTIADPPFNQLLLRSRAFDFALRGL